RWRLRDVKRNAPRLPQHPPRRARDQIVDDPRQRARHVPRDRRIHLGADDMLEPQEFVVRGNLPVRPGCFDVPTGNELGLELRLADFSLALPDVVSAFPRLLEEHIVALRALRIEALDIKHMPPPYEHRIFLQRDPHDGASLCRPAGAAAMAAGSPAELGWPV